MTAVSGWIGWALRGALLLALLALLAGGGRVGAEPIPSHPRVRVEQITGPAPAVRTTVAMRIPVEELGRKRWAAGTKVRLKAWYETHGQVHRVEWEGEYGLGR